MRPPERLFGIGAFFDVGDSSAGFAVVLEILGPVPTPTPTATPTVLPTELNDGEGFRWDIQPDGNINNGSVDAYDGGLAHQGFGFFSTGLAEDDGREIVIGPSPIGGPNIEVTRKIYVPSDEGYARFLEIVTNAGATPATYVVNLFTNLGSDGGTNLVATSSGDAVFNAEDNWLVTDDQDGQNDPSMTHVIAGGGPVRPQQASTEFDNINYSYQLQLAPGQTQIVDPALEIIARGPEIA